MLARRHQHRVPGRHRVIPPRHRQRTSAFQDKHRVVPLVGMAARFRVADRARRHRPVVQHQVVGAAVPPPQQRMPRCAVQVGIVADHRRNPGPRFAAPGPRLPPGRRHRVDLNPPDVTLPAVVARHVIHPRRYEHRIPGPHRIRHAVGHQCATPGDDIHLMLPLVDVVRTGAARRNDRVGQRNQRRVVPGPNETRRRLAGISADVANDGFHQSKTPLIRYGLPDAPIIRRRRPN